MGDFNAKLGSNWKDIGSKCVGKFCSSNTTNENGEYLQEFAEKNNLKIANTFYKKKKSRKWTWDSPDDKTKNEIDYMLVNDLKIVKDVEVVRKFKFPSDHRPVNMKVTIPNRCEVRNAIKGKRASKMLIPEQNIQKAKQKLREKLENSGIKLVKSV